MAEVDRALEDGAARRNEGLKSWYDRMRELGGSRYIIKPSTTAAVDDLAETSPNFADVIDDLRKFLALAIAGNEAVQFTPMLLLGEPGLGKTYFAKKLAHALGTGFEFVSMSSLTAGWVLTGASAQWNNARPGKVAQTLIEGEYANPVVVLDEIDKAGGDAATTRWARSTRCSSATRRRTSRTSSSTSTWTRRTSCGSRPRTTRARFPEPILNRMNVYAIERPDAEGVAPHRARRLPRDPRRASLAVPAGAVRGGARAARGDPAARHAQAPARRVRHRAARRPRPPRARGHRREQALRTPRTDGILTRRGRRVCNGRSPDADTSERPAPPLLRIVEPSREGFVQQARQRAIGKDAPPVWQRAQ